MMGTITHATSRMQGHSPITTIPNTSSSSHITQQSMIKQIQHDL